ncbi:MAG: glycosyltransferase, partial [Acetanaerobacterium sp.]
LGMEYRHFYLARELVRMGHNVTIVAASFSHLRGQNPLPEHSLQETIEDGVTFLWLKTPPYYRNNLFRARNVAVFLFLLCQHARHLADICHPDAVVASSTYLLDIYPAARIAKRAGARLVFELHDVWPLTL